MELLPTISSQDTAYCVQSAAPDGDTSGEVPEWSNGPDSKSGVRFSRTVGSNPTLSARKMKGPFTGPFVFLAERGCG